ncbi:integrase family protein [Caldalkalibacillus thermarum TA2.A1]|uniref:Integrase family protein n=1 Tax=Caldalkalibacillus thermarum (strain TA2.A1) TaxID=986075 RepID=F5L3S9_CALTT|nr:tyrosine-type recombinase/integrase [Caldalkalibacillus thermarum]EGL84002.1 integrase family protein [Caldalkalibacillus thermarum TA2.A1]QZT33065.1 tyrosine-type recombinase/integrase [Caldalkalibacillus thermarum TA2.A1]
MISRFINEGLKGKSKPTIRTYEHALKQFEQWLHGAGTDLEGYSRSDVQRYLDYLVANKKSAATINKIWNAIKKYSRWAGKEDAIEDIAVIQPPQYYTEAPKSLSQVERNRLIREVDRSGNKRDFAIVQMLFNTGLRVSELVSLDRSDVEISERKGSVKVVGKGNRERIVPLNKETRRALQRYLDERTDSHPALFLSNRGQRISVRSVQYLLEKHGVHPHQLRHTFITGLMRNNIDIAVIQSMSGHTSTKMIVRYSQPTEEDKTQAVEELWYKKQ